MTDPNEGQLYIELLKRVLTRYGFSEGALREISPRRKRLFSPLATALRKRGLVLARPEAYDPIERELGRDWPAHAETMVGLRRLDNLHDCIRNIIDDGVPGDLVETGVWRGGSSIFMKGVLAAYGEKREVWLCDSFEGLPPPDEVNFPQDAGIRLDKASSFLGVTQDAVKQNFERYDLLDDSVHFVKGWFKDTLGNLPVEQISLLRLDGDLYESTIQALEPLYPKLVVGGYCVIDDYGNIEACKRAVHDYRSAHGIDQEIVDIDGYGAFWRKTS
ncbi:macrocin O-methyltransferase [Mycobacterium sp. CBMA 234]|uniref:TylF/MycF/NovP-related O-methyltransferase n=1 Tax=Mycolicibacterium sp. CBMA 234 TaxID=1918495 RepID=UPI0012DE7A7E|nr:TylF/MycF/NovP-related O-methyltransferase [Mycolicibacterium sp. CBMA 234]MUL63461.1 macrocin O-methyltransferase [Mycolicibacterium sp. CBMA 234]